MNTSSSILRLKCTGLAWMSLLILNGCHSKPDEHPEEPSPPEVAVDAPPNSWPGSLVASSTYAFGHTAFYTESCDGSGAVALDQDHFIVANDETSHLLIYHRHQPGAPLQRINIRKALDLKKKDEADLEGLARIDDRLYVIGSHARDSRGNKEKTRRKFLSIHIAKSQEGFLLKPIGKAYEDLLDDLDNHEPLKPLDLKSSAKSPGDEVHGLNIEGLCAGSNGSLWLCFRGPRIRGQALIISLLNPSDVAVGARARFGPHHLLDLQGRVIRGAGYFDQVSVIVATDPAKTLPAACYLADPNTGETSLLDLPNLNGLDPESVVIYPDTGLQALQILSDDGGKRLLGKDCKDWDDTSVKRFRSGTWQWNRP